MKDLSTGTKYAFSGAFLVGLGLSWADFSLIPLLTVMGCALIVYGITKAIEESEI